MGKTITKIFTKADALIGVMSVSTILVGGAIVIGDKAVHVLARYFGHMAKLIKK